MKYLNIIFFVFILSCAQENKDWKEVGTISLGDITPIGLAMIEDHLWIADGDNNRVIEINLNGKIQQSLSGFERPMHLDNEGTTLYVPEYGSDQIVKLDKGSRTIMAIPDSLDAPAGIDVLDKELAIADFYNHRILYYNGSNWISFGKEGKAKGELYYPTDVTIGKDKLFVADAYNNRVQVFDKKGNAVSMIGANEKINAATGIFATDTEILITDFENDRVLSYNMKGELLQIIETGINKPTDILIDKNILYIANYKGKNIIKFAR